MLTLDFSALARIPAEHGLSEAELADVAGRLPQFLAHIQTLDQGFFSDTVLENDALCAEIETFAREARQRFTHIILLGIGGSALGAIALKKAFGNIFTGTTPQLLILDNIDPVLLAEATSLLDFSTTLFVVVTKSGGTPETLAQYFYFSKELQNRNLSLTNHFVFVTDPEKGFLRAEAARQKIPTFPIPPNVGGRFSVLTAVGLLPAALCGIDIRGLLSGARTARDSFFRTKWAENISFQIATIQYLLSQKGKAIQIFMPYAQKLFRLADWYRQLLAESLGKKQDRSGEDVFVGLTPANALGVTDQHSQAQLYMEGPFDKLLIFLEVEKLPMDMAIPLPPGAPEEVRFLQGVSFEKLLHTEKAATAEALTRAGRPHITIRLPEISPENLGAFFLLLEGSVAFLGEYFEINAFDQPGVELSKKLTREFLLTS